MIVFRVGRTKYANDLTGEGARLYGGRWNHILTPCIYTSETRALAVLEYTVNVNIEDIPRSLSITAFEIPDKQILQLTPDKLPGDWQVSPAPFSTKAFGTQLLQKLDFPVIRIPSAVIHQEYNYLLNPAHHLSSKFVIANIQDFVYDVRIKTV